jgi:hypothetical protein
MKINTLFPSRYLKVGDFSTPKTLTIGPVIKEKMRDSDGVETEKPVLYFVEFSKGLVLNRTNGDTLAKLFGDESDDWKGKRVSLISVKVSAFGKVTDALRVDDKLPANASSTPYLEPPTHQPTDDEINAALGDSDEEPF